MKRIFFTFIVFFVSTMAFAQTTKPKLLAIQFYADWCKSCKKMGTSFVDLQESMKKESVEFIVLDYTDKTTQEGAMNIIDEKGIGSVVKKYAGTGFILLVDNMDKVAKGKLTYRKTTAEMEDKIHSFL